MKSKHFRSVVSKPVHVLIQRTAAQNAPKPRKKYSDAGSVAVVGAIPRIRAPPHSAEPEKHPKITRSTEKKRQKQTQKHPETAPEGGKKFRTWQLRVE